MSTPSAVLAEPLTLGQESIPRGTWSSGKALLVIPFAIGFVLAVFFSAVPSTSSEVDAINMRGSPMSMSCPRTGPTMSVNAMQNTLKKYGVPPSPMERFALTAYAATRDVSMAAQAKAEFLKLDTVTQAKLKKLQKDVVVRASSIAPEDLAGITGPLGSWDPAGFSESGNVAAYRRAELKHGRVCMQASLGILVSEKFPPIFDAWGEGPYVSAVATHFTDTARMNFWPAFWIMAAGHELATSLADYDGKELGDYGFDPLGLRPEDPEELKVLENKELNNGLLAMVSAAGMIAQELVTGKNIF